MLKSGSSFSDLLFSGKCAVNLDYYTELAFFLIFPLACFIVALILVFPLFLYIEIQKMIFKKQAVGRFSHTYWLQLYIFTLVVLFYILYITVTGRAVEIFSCKAIDDESWLFADLTVKCYTSKHIGFMVFSAITLVYFSCGFPLLVVALARKVPKMQSENSELQPPDKNAFLLVFPFLFDGYRLRCGINEAAILARKALITIVIGLLIPSANAQVYGCTIVLIAAILLVLFFPMLYLLSQALLYATVYQNAILFVRFIRVVHNLSYNVNLIAVPYHELKRRGDWLGPTKY